MANKNIFCNTPWFEAHIYWDGGLGICCQESQRLYQNNEFNIKTTSLKEWFNSQPARKFRTDLLSDKHTDICNRCTSEEQFNSSSRRYRSNQKSVIFMHESFDDSYIQSPNYPHFKLSELNDGLTHTLPVDFHIDLGNYCNLACKMCYTGASSKIATQYVKWGYPEHKKYLGSDWTKDTVTWNKFLNELLELPYIQNIHFMGGETLLTPRFEEFVDFFIANNRTDIGISFITNGMIYNQRLMEKLSTSNFKRVGIEVSIETVSPHNEYIRQGANTSLILDNIKKFSQYCNNSSISLTIRPTITCLSLGYYYTLIEFCLEHKLLIKSLLVTEHKHLYTNVIPYHIKQQYLPNYVAILEKLDNIVITNDFNESDPNNYKESIKLQVEQVISMLQDNAPVDDVLLQKLVEYCRKWDNEYKFDARVLYPELADIFEKYEY